ncbi:nicotinamide mononucleotide adenylyl transferase [Moniliophthora roreri MCA 2997]|uniref:Nicotinamide-nucleotide adenylyltransferase n=2 Tax=Moniliophthora roreri TaxID=221103 RepID=V2XDT1_MONRO|nr:nicotinamide mononucleotide adenylyl transferase [Moniliophthora roreri MCA 2997]KAI3618943.1 nicotinamide mononucleotide adenylyl transferase [Moniliophthora roreri]
MSSSSSSSSDSPTQPFKNPPNYIFPDDRLTLVMRDPTKTPVVLVACGSFSPVTYLHLRMFEMAKDYARHNTDFEIVGGYLSPVSDMYRKPGLLSAEHRVSMCRLAAQDAPWLMIDPWEAFQSYQRTAVVLDHFEYELNTLRGGVRTPDGEQRNVRVMLLAGSDLISTMSEPGVWSYEDLDHILSRYGCFIIERAGTDVEAATDALSRWRSNIHIISQLIQNDVSSTKVRLFLRRGLSVRYLLPTAVVDYIERNGLYLDEATAAEKEKERKESAQAATAKKEA